jgi:hypothetical protein
MPGNATCPIIFLRARREIPDEGEAWADDPIVVDNSA